MTRTAGREPKRMRSYLDDLRHAVRTLRRNRGFTSMVVLTLGLGMGGAVAIFSLVNALLLRPLPFQEEARLVRMRDEVSRPGHEPWRYNTSPRSFVFMRRRAGVFSGIVAQRYRPMVVTGRGDPTRVIGIGVSSGWMRVLGVGPVLGRPFTAEEEALGDGARVALIGFDLWRTRFGGAASVLGESVTLNGGVYTVVGVMPRSYNYPYGAQVWVPDTFDPDDVASGPNVVGRLRDGLSLDAAQRELDLLSRQLAQAHPDSHGTIRLLAVPVRDDLVSNNPRLALVLLVSVGFLLLLACFNIANLLLIRGTARRREMALRLALGATALRRVRQLFAESLLLGLGGAAVGLAVATSLHGFLARLSIAPDTSLGAFFTDLSLDGRVLGFAFALALATAVISGMVPALRSGRPDIRNALRGAGRTSTGRHGRLISGLVAAELAVALTLLGAATLMTRNLVAFRHEDRGYATRGRVTLRLSVPVEPDARPAWVAEALRRVTELPGATRAGTVQQLPMDDGSWSSSISIDGGEASTADRRLLANSRIVAGDYMEAMGIRVLEGRGLRAEEILEGRPVVLVNRAFADRYWPAGDALGGRMKTGALDSPRPWLTVVGVVADADENYDLAETYYEGYGLVPVPELNLVVEARADAAALLPAVRQALRALDPGQPLDRITTIEERLADTMTPHRTAASLSMAFAAFGLLLVVLGIYGVLGHAVEQGRKEIAVRRALGLTGAGAFRLVLTRAGLLVMVGLAVGLPGADALNELLTRLLGGTTRGVALDIRLLADTAALPAGAYAALAGLVAVIALAAAALPAWRAARRSPAEVLRSD